MPAVVVPFVLRDLPGFLDVVIARSGGPADSGLHLVDPGLPSSAGVGLPTCTATVHYPGRGYAAAMGWVQLVRCDETGTASGFEADPLALLSEVNTPYAFFGISPTLYDAPYRSTGQDLRWQARSYLSISGGAVISRTVEPVAAFSWGFRIVGGQILVDEPAVLPIDTWTEHQPLLSARYPGWRF